MAPLDFNHPYEPYAIQQQLMTALYDCIDQGKVGIFESPTGTGKSLSLICASLTWLRRHKRQEIEAAVAGGDEDEDEPEWMRHHASNERRRRLLEHRQDLEHRLARIRHQEEKIKQRCANGAPPQKRRRVERADERRAEDEFLLDDYESDGAYGQTRVPFNGQDHGISEDTKAIIKRLAIGCDVQAEESEEMPEERKVFYCSRTHSQLSQFASELRRVRMPPVMSSLDDGGEADLDSSEPVEELRHLTLGSRKNLCINPKVKRLGNAEAMNERCVELQQSKTSPEHKCPYLPAKENEAVVHEFRDHALAKIHDIEDLGNLGKRLEICPYYATRSAIKPSEVSALDHFILAKLTLSSTDRYTSLPSPFAKVGARGFGPILEGPCDCHRRGTQPHGRNHGN